MNRHRGLRRTPFRRKPTNTGPDPATQALVIARDSECVAAGIGQCLGRVICNHRINRGMGGSRLLNNPANLIAACFEHNGWFEDHPEQARANGWKLRRGDDPLREPVLYPDGRRRLLDDAGGRIIVGH